jgi:hypothetical protein
MNFSKLRPQPLDIYQVLDKLPSEQVAQVILKASLLPQNLIGYEDIEIANPRDPTDTESLRRAISTVSNLYNIIGMPRTDFNKGDNDLLASNAYFAVVEKSMCDYMSTLSWTIVDKSSGKEIEDEVEWLSYPNPEDSFGDITKAMIPDLLRYDAGTWVKSFKKNGYVEELKSYLGTEFWKEIDRLPMNASAGPNQPIAGIWSHGYTKRYWQRSRPGVYIAFQPDEICYFSMYKRSDTVYGRDFLQSLKWQIQYLIDSTRAAGKTFANGVVPSLVWKHPQVHDIKALSQRINDVKQNNMGANRFGSVLHLVRDEEVSTLAHTLHDMEWLEGQKFIAQLVWAMWGFQPQEFMGDDVNRATAYISRNITKSKLLYPLMRHMEIQINRNILPYRQGWNKNWRFEFIKDVDLDDKLKEAEISQIVANSAAVLRGMGLTIESAMKIAGAGDDLNTIEVDQSMLQQIKMDAQVKTTGTTAKKDTQAEAEKYKGSSTNKIPFGDSEERQAGIKKGKITLTGDEDTEVNFVFGKDVGVYTNRKQRSKEIGREIVKEVQWLSGHSRDTMASPNQWMDTIQKAVEKYDLDIVFKKLEDE